VQVEVYDSLPCVEAPIIPPQVPSEVVKLPVEREHGRARNYVVDVGGAHDESHDEEEEN